MFHCPELVILHMMDDAIAVAAHTALTHLNKGNTYVRSLASRIPARHSVPSTRISLRSLILDWKPPPAAGYSTFPTGRPLVVRNGGHTSSPLILSAGEPQGCVLGPFHYSLLTYGCAVSAVKHSSNIIIKFTHDMILLGLITDNDETAYREEVKSLTS